jgi:hypothetical protein
MGLDPDTIKRVHVHNFSIVCSPQSGAKMLSKYLDDVQTLTMSAVDCRQRGLW